MSIRLFRAADWRERSGWASRRDVSAGIAPLLGGHRGATAAGGVGQAVDLHFHAALADADPEDVDKAITMASAISPPPCWSDSFSPRFDSEFQLAASRWLAAGPDWRWAKAQGVQESGLDPAAVSPVGARGVMQVMPATWVEIQKAMGWRGISPHSASHNIFGGVWYQARMARIWAGRDRSVAAAYDLGLASYNAGVGTVLRAQTLCADARLWTEIAPCLISVSGRANARQTIDYVSRIAQIRSRLGHAMLEAE
jgi:hypothetical protein